MPLLSESPNRDAALSLPGDATQEELDKQLQFIYDVIVGDASRHRDDYQAAGETWDFTVSPWRPSERWAGKMERSITYQIDTGSPVGARESRMFDVEVAEIRY